MASIHLPQEAERKCLLCQQPFSPTASFYGNDVFCCLDHQRQDWLLQAVPIGLLDTKPDRLPNRTAFQEVQAWASDMVEHGSRGKPWLVLFGLKSGTGKTRCAIHAAARLVEKNWRGADLEREMLAEYRDEGHAGLFFSSRDLRTKYDRVRMNAEEKADLQDVLVMAELIVFDDLDKVRPTDGFMEWLFGILDGRSGWNRSTIFTTNLVGLELEQKWGPEYGPYLVRRMREFSTAIDFDTQE